MKMTTKIFAALFFSTAFSTTAYCEVVENTVDSQRVNLDPSFNSLDNIETLTDALNPKKCPHDRPIHLLRRSCYEKATGTVVLQPTSQNYVRFLFSNDISRVLYLRAHYDSEARTPFATDTETFSHNVACKKNVNQYQCEMYYNVKTGFFHSNREKPFDKQVVGKLYNRKYAAVMTLDTNDVSDLILHFKDNQSNHHAAKVMFKTLAKTNPPKANEAPISGRVNLTTHSPTIVCIDELFETQQKACKFKLWDSATAVALDLPQDILAQPPQQHNDPFFPPNITGPYLLLTAPDEAYFQAVRERCAPDNPLAALRPWCHTSAEGTVEMQRTSKGYLQFNFSHETSRILYLHILYWTEHGDLFVPDHQTLGENITCQKNNGLYSCQMYYDAQTGRFIKNENQPFDPELTGLPVGEKYTSTLAVDFNNSQNFDIYFDDNQAGFDAARHLFAEIAKYKPAFANEYPMPGFVNMTTHSDYIVCIEDLFAPQQTVCKFEVNTLGTAFELFFPYAAHALGQQGNDFGVWNGGLYEEQVQEE